MTLQLGRLTLTDVDVDVEQARYGDQLDLKCRAWLLPHAPLRRQLVGMDGHVVAVTWAHDRTWAGFYRLSGPSVEVVHLDDAHQVADFAVDLQPVAGGNVDFESTLTGAALTNAHGLTDSAPWVATPVGVDGLHADPPAAARLLRATPDGDVRVWTGAPRHSVWSVDPAGFYAGGVQVRQNLAVVTGRHATDPPGVFELSNGLCRVRWIVGEVDWDQIDGTWDDMGDLTWDDMGGVAGVEVAIFNGVDWVGKVWDLGITPNRVAVTANTAHMCAVRLIEELDVGRRVLDLSMRRGARWVHGHIRAPVGTRQVLRADAEAATLITAGVKATNSTSEVRYVAATPVAFTADLVQGGFTVADADRLTFMVGGSAPATESPEPLVDQWVSYRAEDVRAVLR